MRYIHISLLILLLMLGACAKSPKAPSLNTADSDGIWKNYLKHSQKLAQPFRTHMSLRYGTEGDTRRVTALLWGNSSKELRLDVNAGIGVNVAKILENDQLFFVFIPRENVAYFHEGAQKPLFKAGVPIPFNLQQLTQLIEGNYSNVFGTEYNSTIETANNNNNSDQSITNFELASGKLMGTLTLNYLGLPVSWKENTPQGWNLDLSYKETSLVPYKLNITHHETGKRVILLIKERELTKSPFTAEQMRLILPDSTNVLPLEQAKQL